MGCIRAQDRSGTAHTTCENGPRGPPACRLLRRLQLLSSSMGACNRLSNAKLAGGGQLRNEASERPQSPDPHTSTRCRAAREPAIAHPGGRDTLMWAVKVGTPPHRLQMAWPSACAPPCLLPAEARPRRSAKCTCGSTRGANWVTNRLDTGARRRRFEGVALMTLTRTRQRGPEERRGAAWEEQLGLMCLACAHRSLASQLGDE